MSTKTARQTRCTPLAREQQRACAASVGRGLGVGAFLPFVCLKLTPTPSPSPHGGGERIEFAAIALASRGILR
jgi:hypothetical protein